MQHDLLFHIVQKNEFKSAVQAGEYIPGSIEQEGFIHCSTGFQVNNTANRLFSDKQNLLLLIIDANRVNVPVKYEKDEETGNEFPHIYGPLNTASILDKIEIAPGEDGKFDLQFTSK